MGEKIEVIEGKWIVPNHPIIPFIEGDGIGADITKASLRVWDAAVEKAYNGQKSIEWLEIFAGEKANAKYGEYLPKETIEKISEYHVAIKGPLTTPVGGGFRSLNVSLRQILDLYANVRPIKYFEGTPNPVKNPRDVDMVIFRENTEDVYSGIEWPANSKEAEDLKSFLKKFNVDIRENTGIGIKPISEFCSKRLVRKAIRYAIENNRKSVTLVHKGNIMKYTEGAFKKWGYEVAKEEFNDKTITENEIYDKYDGILPTNKIVIKDRIADNMFQQLLTRAKEYDILATTNLNGDYLSDAIAGQVGGLGLAPGGNIGDNIALFEAVHGTAPKYANKDIANPSSLILSGVMLFKFIKWNEVADLITKAMEKCIKEKKVTNDLARQIGIKSLSTSEYASEIIKNM